MRRLKKTIFLRLCAGVVAVLTVIRWSVPIEVTPSSAVAAEQKDSIVQETPIVENPAVEPSPIASIPKSAEFKKHPIRGVYSFQACFPDLQEVQILAARKWGVRPVKNRQMAEQRKSDLVYVGADPYFQIDPAMRQSIPYLVPRASSLLRTIGRNFLDSLYVKGVPLHKIIVSSVLRSEDDVARLRRFNGNASEQSCHRFGTTFDITYNRYMTVSPPDGPQRRSVQNDTLKWILSEVLRDIRQEGRCYVKYEVKQSCFHITVR